MSKWKPKVGETYYMPWLIDCDLDCIDIIWNGTSFDEKRYASGFVCRTKEEAIELSDKMLMVAKKYGWISCENSNLCNEEYQERLEDDYYMYGSLFDCQWLWFVMMFISICIHFILYLASHV